MMKIGSVNSIVGQYNKIQTEPVQSRVKREQAMDRVELSPEAQVFSEAFAAARKSMQAAEPERELRVNDIMQRMRSGSYRVDVRDVCDKLLA